MAAMGGDVEALDDGFYRVTTPDGYVFTTHGPDTTALLDDGHGESLGPGDPERDPICSEGYVAHVLYGYPGIIGTDRLDEVKEEIRAHIRRMNDVVNESSLASGGPTADLKVACDQMGEIRVDSFSNDALLPYSSFVFDAARAAGFVDPKVDYVIFYDDEMPGICGQAQLSRDDSPAETNGNNDGGYGVTYINCWYSRTPLHENGHTQGAVLTGAPNEDGTNHCTEQSDIMCYPSTSSQCDIQWYDCGFDTYFDSAPEPGEWLATHWNIGSRVNRYIVFGDAPTGPPSGPAGPPSEPAGSPSDPAGRTVERSISFDADAKRTGIGTLSSSDDDPDICLERVPVTLERRNSSGRWKRVAETEADPGFRFRIKRPGAYRATSAELRFEDGATICTKASSRIVRFR